jgi:hypothetical protein
VDEEQAGDEFTSRAGAGLGDPIPLCGTNARVGECVGPSFPPLGSILIVVHVPRDARRGGAALDAPSALSDLAHSK